MFPKPHIGLESGAGGLSPSIFLVGGGGWSIITARLRPPEIIYFCKYRQRRVYNYAYLDRKIQNFLRQGALPPCNLGQGASPWTPVNASRKRALSARFARNCLSPHVENLPKLVIEENVKGPFLALQGSNR